VTISQAARRDRGRSTLGVLGVPASAGARQLGQESAPALFRRAGMIEVLRDAGAVVRDYGDLPIVPYSPDRHDRSARNVRAVVSVVRDVARAVAELDRDGVFPLVIGGDCTISIGVIAGLLPGTGNLGLVYLDGDIDLNTPSTTATGIFDGMGLAHILGRGSTALSGIGPRKPLLEPERIVLFGYQDAWLDETERGELSSAGMLEFPRSAIEDQPERAAEEALRELKRRADRFVVHFDVDVVDHPDLPVADVPHFGGLSLDATDRCLRSFLGGIGPAALVLTEFNAFQDPEGTAAQDLIGRIAHALAQPVPQPTAGRTEATPPSLSEGS
jgi:arginase